MSSQQTPTRRDDPASMALALHRTRDSYQRFEEAVKDGDREQALFLVKTLREQLAILERGLR